LSSRDIVIGDEVIRPGERRSLELALPALYSQTPVSMPVQVINGRRPGPTLFVSAAIHGDEINGVEIIRRLLKRPLGNIRGALIAVPVVNVYGFVSQSRYLPDRRDLNRSFPGSESGSMAGRLAHTFMQSIVTQCTHGIDLHTGAIGRENLPQIRAQIVDGPLTAAMAHAFGAPVILNAELRDGSLREAVNDFVIPVLLYEAGEALRFDEVSIRAGVKGIVNVMRHLDMLPASRSTKARPECIVAQKSQWVRAPESGILRTIRPLGATVSKGETIAWVADPFGHHEDEILAPVSGIIIGKTNHPLVHEGEALIHIARFKEPDDATQAVEAFQDEHDPLADIGPGKEPVIV
jgi:predicted deacylase